MPPALVIFDLDGTLIDSAADLAVAINTMLAGYGREPLPVAEVRRMVGMAWRCSSRALSPQGIASRRTPPQPSAASCGTTSPTRHR